MTTQASGSSCSRGGSGGSTPRGSAGGGGRQSAPAAAHGTPVTSMGVHAGPSPLDELITAALKLYGEHPPHVSGLRI